MNPSTLPLKVESNFRDLCEHGVQLRDALDDRPSFPSRALPPAVGDLPASASCQADAPGRGAGAGISFSLNSESRSRILRKLVRNAGTPVASSELHVGRSCLATTITQIRRHLPVPATILSVRDVGYMITPAHAELIRPLLEEI